MPAPWVGLALLAVGAHGAALEHTRSGELAASHSLIMAGVTTPTRASLKVAARAADTNGAASFPAPAPPAPFILIKASVGTVAAPDPLADVGGDVAGPPLFVDAHPVGAAFIAMAWALLSASSLLLGAYLAMCWAPSSVTLSMMMAFGGGALVEALSLELFGHVRMFQRQGEPSVMWVAIAAAWVGGVLYYGLERMLNNRGAFLRSKFYLERAIRQYHDALRSQTAAWEEGFKRAWVRDHAKRQPDDGLPAGDEYITELAAAQAAAAGSAAAVAAQMAVDAGQPTEVVISAGEAAGLAVSDAAAKGVTDVLATAAGEAAAVAVQRAADEGKPPSVAQAAGRAAGEAAARGLTSVEAEAAGDAAAEALQEAVAATAATAAASAVRKAVQAGLPSKVAVATGRAAGDAAARGIAGVQPAAAGDAAAEALQRADRAAGLGEPTQGAYQAARAAGEAAAIGLTPSQAAAVGKVAAEATQEAVDAGQPAAVADAAGRAAGEAAAQGLTAAEASAAGSVAAEAAQRVLEAGQSSEAALAAGRAAGAVASRGLTEAHLMAHTAEAHKQASKLPALARQATEASVIFEDGSSSDELPFGVPVESPRIALVRDLGLDELDEPGHARGDATPGSRMTMRSLDSTASVFDTERGRSAAIAIWLGILLDGIPESLVLGIMSNEATDLRNPGLMYSLTFSVLISNLPEALVSASTMKKCGMSTTTILLLWWSNFILSGVGAFVGSLLFPPGKASAMTHLIQAGIEGACGGAILVMISNTVFPEAFEKGGGGIGLASLAGFLLAFTVGI